MDFAAAGEGVSLLLQFSSLPPTPKTEEEKKKGKKRKGEIDGFLRRALHTERKTHHDIRPRQLSAAEKAAPVGRCGELALQEIPLGAQVWVQEFGFEGAGEEEGEGAEEEGG